MPSPRPQSVRVPFRPRTTMHTSDIHALPAGKARCSARPISAHSVRPEVNFFLTAQTKAARQLALPRGLMASLF